MFCTAPIVLQAQPPPRSVDKQDEYTKVTILKRIDTRLKGNESLSPLAEALLKALETDSVRAVYPNNPNRPLDFASCEARIGMVTKKMQRLTASFEHEFDCCREPKPLFNAYGDTSTLRQALLEGCKAVIDLEYEQVFDKTSSRWVPVFKYIRLVWLDPRAELPPVYIAAFQYDAVVKLLERIEWQNPNNDAIRLNMRQVFDLHEFNGELLQVKTGDGRIDLSEPAKLREKLIELEHKVWQY
jgi:hypothetical protein